METPVDPSRTRASQITQDPIDELDAEGRAMLEKVRVGLGFVPASPQRLGRFVLGRCLGAGGMGVVHVASDPQLGREVAIKRIRPRPYISSDTLRRRLEREGQTLAKLTHPNVLHVYELGEHEGEVFLAMEYVPGQTLSQWQEAPGRTRPEILHAYAQAGRGIAAAHAAQIIHRDFKPENVLVGADGRVTVGDFGLAALLRELQAPDQNPKQTTTSAETDRLTGVGELVGTVQYMAPERLRGEPGDERGDQFSFCVALWEALTGELPFAGDTNAKLPDRILSGQLLEGKGLPRWLRSVLRRGLAPTPEQRLGSMDEIVRALERGLSRPKRWLLGSALTGAGLIALLGVAYGLARQPEPQAEPPPCDLQEALSSTPTPSEWAPLRQRLGPEAARLKPLERHLRQLTRDARRMCHAEDERAPLEHAVAWLKDLQRLLSEFGGSSQERLLDYIDWLSDARLHGPPPAPLDPQVTALLDASEQSELENDLQTALSSANRALESSQTKFEEADALLRRGRVRSLQGDYALALQDFRAARNAADKSDYDDARLRASLLSAELALKRLDDDEGSWHYLDAADSAGFHEPILSPRLAHCDELRAIRERRAGRSEVALALQLRALVRRVLAQDPPHLIARSLAGLAIIAEVRSEAALAEWCYRQALSKLPGLSPDRFQVAYMLGRWIAERVLANDAEAQPEEARLLLRAAMENRVELRLAATSMLLRMELIMEEDNAVAVEQLRESLAEQVHTGPGTDVQRYEAWQTLSLAYAVAGDQAKLEQAMRQADALAPGELAPLAVARFELSVAGLASDPEIQGRYLASARFRLKSLPASAERDEMLDFIHALDGPTP